MVTEAERQDSLRRPREGNSTCRWIARHPTHACRWVGAKRFVYGHPLKNPISAERMVQYVKEGTEAFDGLSGRALERALNWLSAFMFMQDFAFENGGLGRPPLERKEEEMPPWLNGPRPVPSLG